MVPDEPDQDVKLDRKGDFTRRKPRETPKPQDTPKPQQPPQPAEKDE